MPAQPVASLRRVEPGREAPAASSRAELAPRPCGAAKRRGIGERRRAARAGAISSWVSSSPRAQSRPGCASRSGASASSSRYAVRGPAAETKRSNWLSASSGSGVCQSASSSTGNRRSSAAARRGRIRHERPALQDEPQVLARALGIGEAGGLERGVARDADRAAPAAAGGAAKNSRNARCTPRGDARGARRGSAGAPPRAAARCPCAARGARAPPAPSGSVCVWNSWRICRRCSTVRRWTSASPSARPSAGRQVAALGEAEDRRAGCSARAARDRRPRRGAGAPARGTRSRGCRRAPSLTLRRRAALGAERAVDLRPSSPRTSPHDRARRRPGR